MPLKSGSSKKTISANIGEILRANKGAKKIGTTKKVMSKTAKVKQAAAISFAKAGKSKKK